MEHHSVILFFHLSWRFSPPESALPSAASTADSGAEQQQQGNSTSAAAAGAEAALSSLVSPVFSMQGVRYGLITGCCRLVMQSLGHNVFERFVCVTWLYFTWHVCSSLLLCLSHLIIGREVPPISPTAGLSVEKETGRSTLRYAWQAQRPDIIIVCNDNMPLLL